MKNFDFIQLIGAKKEWAPSAIKICDFLSTKNRFTAEEICNEFEYSIEGFKTNVGSIVNDMFGNKLGIQGNNLVKINASGEWLVNPEFISAWDAIRPELGN